jgi:hypothetical protein
VISVKSFGKKVDASTSDKRCVEIGEWKGRCFLKAPEFSEFIQAYTRLLTQVWSSEEFSRRLAEGPRSVLSECGLRVPAEAELEIVREDSADAEADLALQVELWSRGFSTGSFVLYVPHLPQMDVREFSDADLGDLAGGVNTCCCSPCCCQAW